MFYDQLIMLCNKNNIKPTPLLKNLGLSPGNLNRWKEGASVNSDILQTLSSYFKVSIDYLLTGKEKISSINLTEDEKQLLNNYKKLSPTDKIRISERAIILVELENEKKYKNIRRKSITQIRHNSYAVSAGTGFFLDDNDSWDMISVPDTPEVRSADYALTVSGDSMQPLYFDEDIILVKEQPYVEIGEIGIFVVNDEGYVKQFGGNRLVSLNENYDDILFTEEDSIKCCGKVIGKV